MPLLHRLQRVGVRKGFVQGSGPWLAVGVSAWGLRTVRRMAQRQTEILIREELKPGQRIVIANGRATIDDLPVAERRLSQPKAKVRRKSKGAIEVGLPDED